MEIRVMLTRKGLETVLDNLIKNSQEDVEIRISSHRTDDCIGIGCRLHNFFADGPRYNTVAVGNLDRLINLRKLFVEESVSTNDEGIVSLIATTTVPYTEFVRWMTSYIENRYRIKGDVVITGFEPRDVNDSTITFTMNYIERVGEKRGIIPETFKEG